MNLGVLRTYRAQLEDRLQGECLQLQQALDEAQAARAKLERDEAHQAHAWLQKTTAGIMPGEAEDYAAVLDALAAQISQQKKKEAGLRAALDQKRVEMLEATKERKKVEILEERKRIEWLRERERRDQQQTDEVAGRHARLKKEHE